MENFSNRLKFNLHTHSVYSDGNSQPVDYIEKALDIGFTTLGFTEHSPLPFDNTFSFKLSRKDEYLDLFRKLESDYAGKITLVLGMEFDFIPVMSENFGSIQAEFGLDYSIGSVHLVGKGAMEDLWFIDGPRSEIYDAGLEKFYGWDIRKAVTAYYRQVNEMLETQKFDVIGHLDKIKMHNRDRFFREDEPWYIRLVDETLELVRQKGVIVEINTRGIYKKRSTTTYPGPEILKKIHAMGIPVMINSDAHMPAELNGEFKTAISIAQNAGIREVMGFQAKQWKTVPL
ncbi:MAG: histidinol-phosphatase [Bacteroidetes bacterium]|nr:histidinol-phosphatase [Bacteroidota bacterium]